MRQLIPLALSANTLVLMWLVGNKRVLGWVLGLAGQVMWFVFIAVFEAWGLLPLAIGLTLVYARNLVRWRWPGLVNGLTREVRRRLGLSAPVPAGAVPRAGLPTGWRWYDPKSGRVSLTRYETYGEAWLAVPRDLNETAYVVPTEAVDNYVETEMGP